MDENVRTRTPGEETPENKLLHVISNSPIFVPDPPEMQNGKPVQRVSRVEAMAQRFTMLDQRIKYLDKCEFNKLDPIRFEIARGLHLINAEKLYMVGGYTSISDYANAVLGFNNVVTSSYVRIAKRFLKRNWPESIFSSVANPETSMEDFGISQLIEMLRLSDDDIKVLMADKRLTYYTSVPKLKALIKEYKAEKANREREAKEESYQTMDAAHEDFHNAYNELKQHLLDVGDLEAANVLLPRIMDQVIIIYREGRDR